MSGVVTNLYESSSLTVEGVIDRCTRIIENSETVVGAGRRMLNPMLSIFLGRNAEEHIRQIQDTYYACWSDHARNLKILKGAYSVQDMEDAVGQSVQAEDASVDTTTIQTAWFWDIMDDRFDQYFECVRQKYSLPVATRNQRVYFIFCSQRDTVSQEKTRQRLRDQLIPWALETKSPLVVLSDATRIGSLNAARVAENYRLAASLMLILNSRYSVDEEKLGVDMAFSMRNGGVFSASYHGCSKNVYDIVGVSLLTIIEKYRQLGKHKNDSFGQGASVQSRLCGQDKDYYALLNDIFEQTILPQCRADRQLWEDLPHTEAMDALREQVGRQEEKGGFLAKLFGGSRKSVSPQEAIASLGDFWNCCLELYYLEPVRAFMESQQGSRIIKDHMYSRMTTVLNYDEMHELLLKESQYVAAMQDDLRTKLPMPSVAASPNAAQLLHDCAVRQVKLEIFKKLQLWLAEAMETLCGSAAGFDELLEKVQLSLRVEQMEHSVVRAYGSHVEQLIEQNRSALTGHIRPSKDEEELLRQLEDTFAELVAGDSKRVFFKSLQGDLQFRIERGAAAQAVNVIADCFQFNMTDAGRLPTLNVPSGTLYCIMNDAMDDLGGTVAAEAIGHRFIVSRSDRIERLFLFQVKPEQIMFSNE